MKSTLYYIHDPMCSWCWAFRPVWQTVQQQLPQHIEVNYLLGGLAADTNQPMPETLQNTIRQTWQHIQTAVPGTEFNHEFWTTCQPRRSTYPACRAVIAARTQGNQYEQAMINAIQHAYYLDAKNPSDDEVLIELAAKLKLDLKQFQTDLNSQQT
ncbi:MAG TPA: DsbA family protein, partial [Crenotrichaceae bacterium]|nr:DsbA family protein [Crenotrichaceae bacterium]